MKSGLYYAEKYKKQYMQMALAIADSSVCERRKVGCVIVLDNGLVAHGFNGMPSESDCECCEDEDFNTKEEVLHAEVNAMNKIPYDIDTKRSACFVTMQPCKNCAEKLVDFGVERVYYHQPYRCNKGLEVLDKFKIKWEII